MIDMICRCGTEYPARLADLNRGWGRSCDKSCAAKRRDFGGQAAKRKDGIPLTMTQSFKGAKRKTQDRRVYTTTEWREQKMHDQAMADCEAGWDGHKDSF
jgi:hypothetical protein